jgi:vesicle-associated membrane protein 7
MEKKAEDIREGAQIFQREAEAVNKMMCWQRYKWWVIGGVIGVVVLALIIAIAAN